jgi:hypothetical protein
MGTPNMLGRRKESIDCCHPITPQMGLRPQMDEPDLHAVHAAAVHHGLAADLS